MHGRSAQPLRQCAVHACAGAPGPRPSGPVASGPAATSSGTQRRRGRSSPATHAARPERHRHSHPHTYVANGGRVSCGACSAPSPVRTAADAQQHGYRIGSHTNGYEPSPATQHSDQHRTQLLASQPAASAVCRQSQRSRAAANTRSSSRNECRRALCWQYRDPWTRALRPIGQSACASPALTPTQLHALLGSRLGPLCATRMHDVRSSIQPRCRPLAGALRPMRRLPPHARRRRARATPSQRALAPRSACMQQHRTARAQGPLAAVGRRCARLLFGQAHVCTRRPPLASPCPDPWRRAPTRDASMRHVHLVLHGRRGAAATCAAACVCVWAGVGETGAESGAGRERVCWERGGSRCKAQAWRLYVRAPNGEGGAAGSVRWAYAGEQGGELAGTGRRPAGGGGPGAADPRPRQRRRLGAGTAGALCAATRAQCGRRRVDRAGGRPLLPCLRPCAPPLGPVLTLSWLGPIS
jgi:hypothetical protein